MSIMSPQYSPNKTILAMALLLVIMGISITLAVVFPYQDLNAMAAVELEATTMMDMENEGSSGGVMSDVISGVESGVIVDDVSPSQELRNENDAGVDESASDLVSSSSSSANLGEDTAAEVAHEQMMAQGHNNEPVEPEPSNGNQVSSVDETSQEDLVDSHENENNSTSLTSTVEHNINNLFGTTDDGASAVDEGSAPIEQAATTDNKEEEEEKHYNCQLILHGADLDSNNILDATEYTNLLSKLNESKSNNDNNDNNSSENNINNTGSKFIDYNSLPFERKVNFVDLSCLCPHSFPTCCGDLNGIYIGNEDMETEDLERVCERIMTLESVDGGEE
eukprot:CAMPEP_0183701950 /NCGR_PEP_ID=MMETSP0737-20130205/183_1 /TAXON_ID=385413 /ORGANISM="Thalassiosira miniscula, Strain CCMP1093" /LENGTH=335 /DNA_ID=CAMNT_0025928461 /DNA_START=287 /DNA_END=1294 /DNA_ORIENTATION=+